MIELRRYQLEDESTPVTEWLRGCGTHGLALVILVCGGDKGSQQRDITRAKAYWADWKRRNS